jgi:hypothetical protein
MVDDRETGVWRMIGSGWPRLVRPEGVQEPKVQDEAGVVAALD